MLRRARSDLQRNALPSAITDAVLDAEGRVWVFTPEVPDGTWGALGQTVTLADIATFASGDADFGRRYAEQRLAERRGSPAVV